MEYDRTIPFLLAIGTRIEAWKPDHVTIALDVRSDHLNGSGVVHGGVLATLLDHAGAFCGLYAGAGKPQLRGMTVSLTCQFIAQTREGTLIATGTRTAGGRNVYFADTAVHSAGGILIAKGSSVHRYRGAAAEGGS
jgi:uncharacterized protein (TIGR00369 family)